MENFVDPVDRLVAQAALGVTERFEGLLVVQRVAKLERDPARIDEELFKKRRRKVFRHIIEYLTSVATESRRPAELSLTAERNVRKLVPPEHEEAITNLGCAVTDAARLLYALLACSLTGTLSACIADYVAQHESLPPTFRPQYAWQSLLEGAYERYCDLILSAGLCFSDHRHVTSAHARIAAYLPPDVHTSLSTSLQHVYEQMPLPGGYRDELRAHQLGHLSQYREYARKGRERYWDEWANTRLGAGRLMNEHVKTIAVACSRFAMRAFYYVENPQPFADGAGDALELLTLYCGLDLDERLPGYFGSIKEFAINYFQRFYGIVCEGYNRFALTGPDSPVFQQMHELIATANLREYYGTPLFDNGVF